MAVTLVSIVLPGLNMAWCLRRQRTSTACIYRSSWLLVPDVSMMPRLQIPLPGSNVILSFSASGTIGRVIDIDGDGLYLSRIVTSLNPLSFCRSFHLGLSKFSRNLHNLISIHIAGVFHQQCGFIVELLVLMVKLYNQSGVRTSRTRTILFIVCQ